MASEIEKQPKKSIRGGARTNSGRPKGTTNKVNIVDLKEDFKARSGMTFEEFVNSEILSAKVNGDKEILQKYVLGLSKYFIQEPTQKVDVTSAGEQLKAAFSFIPVELSEWKQNGNS